MTPSASERETGIVLNDGEDAAYVYTAQPATWARAKELFCGDAYAIVEDANPSPASVRRPPSRHAPHGQPARLRP